MPKPAVARTALVRKNLKKFNYTLPIIIFLVIAIVGAALIVGGSDKKSSTGAQSNSLALPCGPYRNDKTIKVNGQTIHAEVPTTPAAQRKGLGGRPCILSNQGMLFIADTPGKLPIWMKDMRFPIDVVWITPDLKVAAIEVAFQPSSYPEARGSQIPAKYVLELKANRTRELKMDIGTPVSF